MKTISLNNVEDEYETDSEDSDNNDVNELQLVSGLNPNREIDDIELGRRQEESQYNWGEIYKKYEKYGHCQNSKTLFKMKRRRSAIM